MEIAHGSVHVLGFFLDQINDSIKEEIFVHAYPDSMYLAAFKYGQLNIFNRFIINEEASFLRYLFAFIQQMAFDRSHCKISFFGNPEWLHTNKKTMNLYFKNIHIVPSIENVSYLNGAETFKNTQLLEAFWHQQIIS